MKDNKFREIVSLFPEQFKFLWKDISWDKYLIYEIRIRVDCPIMIFTDKGELSITNDGMIVRIETCDCGNLYCFVQESIDSLFSYLCQESVYAYLDEIKRGYITVRGGHRVGVSGEILSLEDEHVAVRRVRYMNIRISRERRGVADKLMPYMYEADQIRNTLIISPPGCGKTTILRDLIRQVSDGNRFGRGKKVGVIDERYELEGNVSRGNLLGIRTDILSGCMKSKGIMMLLRSMSPEVIAVDEIGGDQDYCALENAIHCGCKFLATMHGETLFDTKEEYQKFLKEKLFHYFEKELFQNYVFVIQKEQPGVIQGVVNEKGEWIYGGII